VERDGQEQRAAIWATVPTMVWRVCEEPSRHDYDTSTVVSVAFGGSPSADELQRKALAGAGIHHAPGC